MKHEKLAQVERKRRLVSAIRQMTADVRELKEEREYRWLASGDVAIIDEEIAELLEGLTLLYRAYNNA